MSMFRAPLVVSFIVTTAANGQQRPTPASVPNGWVSVPPPKPQTDAANCANWARDAWSVALSSDSMSILILPARYSYVDTARLADGKLTSVNQGEFGGHVYWEPRNGSRQQVAELNLVAFVPTAENLLGIVGLAHLSSNEGQLVAFQRKADGSWSVVKVKDLGAAPETFTKLRGDTILIVLSGSLVVAHTPDYLRVLHRNAVWRYTYAHSVVRDKAGIIYIGMRSAVVRLTPENDAYREDWLVLATCQRREVVGTLGQCECRRD